MFQIPEPLHPAIVHFPIVLLLIGAGGAVVSLFTERWYVRKWAAIALLLGALGAVVANWSGNNAKETVGVLAESAETLLDRHEELAETTRNIAIVAAVLGLVAAFANLKGMLLRVARVTTAVVSLVCMRFFSRKKVDSPDCVPKYTTTATRPEKFVPESFDGTGGSRVSRTPSAHQLALGTAAGGFQSTGGVFRKGCT